MGSNPYSTPTLQCFGEFRTLTQIGLSGASDGCTVSGPSVGTVSGNNLVGVCARAS